ncbi:MAG: hypothetical protein ACJ75R_07075 [Solirubrobacterales bacterium]
MLIVIGPGVVTYLIASSTGVDPDAVRLAAIRAGEERGTTKGSREGFAEGFKSARASAYRAAYRDAYVSAYKNQFEQAGLPISERGAVKVP